MSTATWYRRSVWNYKGNREYTKYGYELAKERFNANDLDVDCTDRHYVITGCNSGIGLEIAREVAKRGGVLHMVCRNFESAKLARSEIITNTGNDKVHIHTLDLAKPRDVLAWAQEFAANHEKIHVLVNNAGCMVHERKIDEDGFETNFAVNTFSVHLITMTLLPVMQRNEDARVVTVSSAGMLVVRLDPMDLMHEEMEPFSGTLVYSQNKRQQVVMTLWYAQRYDKVHFSAMHPGWADTPAVRNSMPQFFEEMKGNLRTAGEGADTAVWLAISKAAGKYPSGFFFQDREPASTHLPLAWTKTSMEEENLLMQKLMVLMQKIASELPQEEIKPSSDNLSAHIVENGVKAPFASNDITASKLEEINTNHSAVSISKSEEAKLLDKGEDEIDRQTEIQSPVPKEEVLPEEGLKLTEAVVSSSPDLQASLEVEDQDSHEASPSPQPSVESNKESLPEPSSTEVTEEPVPESSADETKEEAGPELTAADSNEELIPGTPTIEDKEEPVPEADTSEEKELATETSEEKEEPASETETSEEKEESAPETETSEETEEPALETETSEEKEEPASETPEEKEKPAPEISEEKEELTAETPGEKEELALETDTSEEKEPTPETVASEEKESVLLHSSTSEGNEESVPGTPTSEEKEPESDTTTTEIKEAVPHPTIPGFRGEPVVEEFVPCQASTEAQNDSHNESRTENSTPDPVSPTPSERIHQSAASVVEHLIDITAEKAAASMSS